MFVTHGVLPLIQYLKQLISHQHASVSACCSIWVDAHHKHAHAGAIPVPCQAETQARLAFLQLDHVQDSREVGVSLHNVLWKNQVMAEGSGQVGGRFRSSDFVQFRSPPLSLGFNLVFSVNTFLLPFLCLPTTPASVALVSGTMASRCSGLPATVQHISPSSTNLCTSPSPAPTSSILSSWDWNTRALPHAHCTLAGAAVLVCERIGVVQLKVVHCAERLQLKFFSFIWAPSFEFFSFSLIVSLIVITEKNHGPSSSIAKGRSGKCDTWRTSSGSLVKKQAICPHYFSWQRCFNST